MTVNCRISCIQCTVVDEVLNDNSQHILCNLKMSYFVMDYR